MFSTDVEGKARTAPEQRRQADRNCRFIEALVAAVFGVAAADLRKATRGRARVAFARQAAMYLAHVRLQMSVAAVGRYFGRDRTTVAHACARIEDCRDAPRWDTAFDLLEAAIDSWEQAGPDRAGR